MGQALAAGFQLAFQRLVALLDGALNLYLDGGIDPVELAKFVCQPALPVQRGVRRTDQQAVYGLQMVAPGALSGGRNVLTRQAGEHACGFARVLFKALTQHAVVQHHRLARAALHRNAALLERLRRAAELKCPAGVVAALHRQLFQREQRPQRCGAQQGGDQQKSNHQKLPERESLQHGLSDSAQ